MEAGGRGRGPRSLASQLNFPPLRQSSPAISAPVSSPGSHCQQSSNRSVTCRFICPTCRAAHRRGSEMSEMSSRSWPQWKWKWRWHQIEERETGRQIRSQTETNKRRRKQLALRRLIRRKYIATVTNLFYINIKVPVCLCRLLRSLVTRRA